MIKVQSTTSATTPPPAPPAPSEPAAHAEDDLTFNPSPQTTIGVELEFPILDKEDGQLVPGAPRILEACAHDKIEGVGAELMQSMLEVRTSVCADVSEA